MPAPIRGVLALLDLPHAGGLSAEDAAAAMLRGGASAIQLRAKRSGTSERISLLERLRAICDDHRASLFVDDDVDAALACQGSIAGVHLGQEDLRALSRGPGGLARRLAQLRDAGLRIGISTHSRPQVIDARAWAPDYVACGPVFPTSSKADADPVVGVATLAWACAHAGSPVVAIGGISTHTVRACVDAGAAAVAVISALVGASAMEVEERTRRLVCAHADARRRG